MNESNNKVLINKFPIAIIGMGVRFPGDIRGVDNLWQSLIKGYDLITTIPDDRWNVKKHYHPNQSKIGRIKTNKGGFINGMKQFDAEFFRIYPRVAHTLDPRQRHILEVTYEAIEDAGLVMDQIAGSQIAVITGVFLGDETKKIAGSDLKTVSSHAVMGTIDTSISARIAYQFNLMGPTLSVDTACSSSLVATQLACNAIWTGDAKMAIAGGVNIMSSHEHFLQVSKGNFLSPDGYCKSFDMDANGYVRGEGAGIVILKPLDQAQKDGDNIYAIIKNAIVNSDGYTKSGMTVPNEVAQLKILKRAYNEVNIDPKDVGYIEAHGTGTPIGDPKECWAFGNMFSKNRKENLIIGSIKTNIGHTEAVAGVAGLVKLALAIKHKKIPKNLHFNNPNPKIKFDEWKLQVPTKLMDWPKTNNQKLIGGVNSFGAGGTNAHIVLEEHISKQKTKKNHIKSLHPYIFALSASTPKALTELTAKYIDFIANSTDSIEDICYSSLTRRSLLKKKIFIITNSKEHLINILKKYLNEESDENLIINNIEKQQNPKTALIFSGQGAQWYGMGRQLLQSSYIYRQILEEIDQIFVKLSGYSLIDELLKPKSESKILQTKIAQPLITALQIGLAHLYKSFNIKIDAVIGHSVGEAAAGYYAGILTLEEAIKVIYYRSKEQDQASDKGKMILVNLNYDQSLKIIDQYKNKVEIAAINNSNQIVLSGDNDAIDQISQQLTKSDIFNKILHVNIAFHSHHMDMVKDNVINNLSDLNPKKPKINIYSTVTGKKETNNYFNNQYCYKNIRDKVLFGPAIEQMLADNYNCFIEIAPHPILTHIVKESASSLNNNIAIFPALIRDIKSFEEGKIYEDREFLKSIINLHVSGVQINFDSLFNNQAQYIKLPHYVWQHQEYWSESKDHEEARIGAVKYPFIQSSINSLTNKYNKIYILNLDKKYQNFLKDHRISHQIVVPGTAQIEIAYEVAQRNYGNDFSHIENIHFQKALFLPNNDNIPEARLEITSDDGDYKIFSHLKEDTDFNLNSSGKICCDATKFQPSNLNLKDLQHKLQKPQNKLSSEEFYNKIETLGLDYGQHFQLIEEIWQDGDEILTKLRIHQDDYPDMSIFNIMPNLADSCLHIILNKGGNKLYLPHKFGKYKIYNCKSTYKTIWSYATIKDFNSNYLSANSISFNQDGEKIFEVQDINLKALSTSQKEVKDEGLYQYQWFEKDLIIKEDSNLQTKSNIVIFANSDQIKLLNQKLPSLYDNIIYIIKGDEFKKDNNNYIINPILQSDFLKLFNDLTKQNLLPDKIINLWACDIYISDNDNSDKLQSLSEELLMPYLYLFQEIAKIDNKKINIYQITKNADQIDRKKDKNINFIQGSLYGMGRVFLNEYPNHQLQMIDLGYQNMADDINHLINEITTIQQIPYETEIAIRDYGRFIRQLTKVNNDKNIIINQEDDDADKIQKTQDKINNNNLKKELSFDANATYLITGGASGLGLTLAQWMFEKGAKNFALNSRSGVKYDSDQKLITKLQKLGANIKINEVKGNIAQEQDVANIINYIQNNMPPLKGIIHSAGMIDDATYPNMTRDKFFKIYNPKALGAWNLHRATLNIKLDLFLLISSVSSIIGIGGQNNYSTANNFLNYLSIYRGDNTKSACFGILDWEFSGMSKSNIHAAKSTYNSIGTIIISKSDLYNKINDLLLSSDRYIMLSPMNWDNFKKSNLNSKDRIIFQKIFQKDHVKNNQNYLPQILAENFNHRQNKIIEILLSSLAKILDIKSNNIDPQKSLNDMNLDSLILNHFRNWIKINIKTDISLMQLAKGPNLTELSNIILGQINQLSNQDFNINNASDDELRFSKDKWFLSNKFATNSKNKIFCLHPIGAGASIFNYFLFNPPQNCEIIALQMPGRENRLNEQNYYNNMEQLVSDLSQQIIPQINDDNIIFWGHSWGGVTLFEVIKYIRKYHFEQYHNIKQLIVTGSIAPQLVTPWKDRDAIKETANKNNSIDRILSTVSYIDDKDYLKDIIPIMKKDIEIIMTYQYQEEEKLNIPILAFGTNEDEVVLIEELKKWQEQTNDNFKLFKVKGDHWFLSRNKEFITEKIGDEIAKIL